MLLDKLLGNLAVDVEPFALCLVSKDWRLTLREPATAVMHFVLDGSGVVRGPHGDAHPVTPYWLVVVPPGTKHALESGENPTRERRIASTKDSTAGRIVAGSPDAATLTVVCGTVRARYGASFGLFDHLGEVVSVDLSVFPEARRAFEGILREQSRADPGGQAITAALMMQCLVYLFRRLCDRPHCPLPWLSALEDPQLARAIDLILEDPGADHTVASLAEAASMSRSAFAARFAAAFGRSPMNLVHHIRMQRAYQLLMQDGTQSTDSVASQVGYSSRSHFARAFKAHHGISPTACRALLDNRRR